ncbi:MAG: sigma-70 family RNA polymerase sigma factor [Bacteroidaceae bacterium]|nr:sigma-70 family RNA polymerase sigma factor [Bacteroidaceae bacterium]
MDNLEQRMIDAARRGEPEGYSYLMTRYSRRVLLLVTQVVSDARDAEEVAQDVFVRAFDRLDMFDQGRGSFGVWIGRIAWNLALNATRSHKLEDLEILDNLDIHEELDDSASEAQRITLLDKAIERLRPEERTLLHLHYYDGHSLQEIAEIMDVGAGPLASRLQRIRQKLTKLISK